MQKSQSFYAVPKMYCKSLPKIPGGVGSTCAVPPPSSEATPTESDNKKPKLEDPETQDQDQDQEPTMNLPKLDPVPSQDVPSRTGEEAEPGDDMDSEPGKLTLPVPLTLPAAPARDERDHKPASGGDADGVRTERDDRARVEPGLEDRTSGRPEGKGAEGLVVGGDRKSTRLNSSH